MRWSETLPPVQQINIPDNHKEICFIFNLYGEDIDVYLKECFYAIRQLIYHTNLSEVGSIRLFIDSREAHRVKTAIMDVGIKDYQVIYTPMVGYMPMSNYIYYYNTSYLSGFRYVFNLDSDMWLFGQPSTKIDLKEHIAEWDKENENTLFGQRVTKKDIDDFFRQARIAPIIRPLIDLTVPLESLKYIGGWFIGVRPEGEMFNRICESRDGVPNLGSDEVFWAAFMHKYQDVTIHEVLPLSIAHVYISGISSEPMNQPFFINTGVLDFMHDKHEANRQILQKMLLEI